MKPLLFALSLLLVGCSKKEYQSQCWQFQVKSSQTSKPLVAGYPIISYSYFDRCELTYDEASVVAQSKNTVTTSNAKIKNISVVITTTNSCKFYSKP